MSPPGWTAARWPRRSAHDVRSGGRTTGTNSAFLVAAAVLLPPAHVARAARYGLRFPSTCLAQGFNLPLGIGNAVDVVVPPRIGEIVRTVLAHRRSRLRLSRLAAAMFIECLLDLLAVGVILAALLAKDGVQARLSSPILMPAAGAATLAAICAVRRSSRLRQAIWRCSNPFNDRTRLGTADARRKIYFHKTISYLRLTTREILRSAFVSRRPAVAAFSRARSRCSIAAPKIGWRPDSSAVFNRSGDRFWMPS